VFVVDEPEEVFETNWELEVNKFDDMGLKESVLRGIYGYGFKDPSPIQQKGILPLI
jgi:translation initiation factor 4A